MNRQEAIQRLDDDGEHKFLLENGPVYVVAIARENDPHALLYEHLVRRMVDGGVFQSSDAVRGGYCRVLAGRLCWWGESSYPVRAANEKVFQSAVDENGIELI